jgi:hypothetical protein
VCFFLLLAWLFVFWLVWLLVLSGEEGLYCPSKDRRRRLGRFREKGPAWQMASHRIARLAGYGMERGWGDWFERVRRRYDTPLGLGMECWLVRKSHWPGLSAISFFCWSFYSYSCFFRIVWVYIRMFINTPF